MNQTRPREPNIFWPDKAKLDKFDVWDLISILQSTVLSNVVCLFGIASNVANLLVIVRQGFADPVNISLSGLAVSDMGGLVSLMWFNLCSSSLIVKLLDPPYAPINFCFLPPGVLRLFFSRLTCYITIFISVQRCLCISYPLKVKIIMTPRYTSLTMLSISVASFFLHCFPLTGTGLAYIGWQSAPPPQNRSLLALITSENFQAVYNVCIFVTSFFQMASFIAIILSTGILVYQLKENTKWRNTVVVSGSESSRANASRNHKLGMMIVSLSAILIACYTPSTIGMILSLCLPYLSSLESPDDVFQFIWSLGFLCEAVKSSVNIFVYYKMSSRYRNTLNILFSAATHETRFRRGKKYKGRDIRFLKK